MSDPSSDDVARANEGTAGTEATEPPPTEAQQDAIDDEERRRRIELCAAVLLGLAGILTAFSAFRAAQTGGDELLGLTEASIARGEANSFYAEYSGTYNSDMQLFLDYEVKLFEDPEIAQMLREQFFSENLETATEAWTEDETGAPTPLAMDEYATPDYDSYQDELANAEERAAFATRAADAGDNFDQASVFLALSLFFAGIAALLKRRPIQYAGLIGSALFMVPGVLAILDGQSIASGG